MRRGLPSITIHSLSARYHAHSEVSDLVVPEVLRRLKAAGLNWPFRAGAPNPGRPGAQQVAPGKADTAT